MFNVTGIIMSIVVAIIYSSTCVLCLILTFSKETYLDIEYTVGRTIYKGPTFTPLLEYKINWINDWLLLHNRSTGAIFAFLSIIDIKLSFWVLSKIY